MDAENVATLLIEQRNLYRLQEFVDKTVLGASRGSQFVLTEELIKRLHRVAMSELLTTAGEYRIEPVEIRGTPHKPPNWVEVPGMMAHLCKYVNENWESSDLIHLGAFVMWMLNYVHPFVNGNGRTARAACYLVMCMRFGKLLPAKNSLVQQICDNRLPYYHCLREADVAFEATGDVRAALLKLEALLSQLLKAQLTASLGG